MKNEPGFAGYYEKYFHRLSEIFSVDITLEQTKNLFSQCEKRKRMTEREHPNTFCHEKALCHVLLELSKKAIFPYEEPDETVSHVVRNTSFWAGQDGELSYEEVFGPYDRAHCLRMAEISESPVTREIVEEMIASCQKRYHQAKGKKPITANHEKTCAHFLSKLSKIAVFPENGERFTKKEFWRFGFQERKLAADDFFSVCHHPDEAKTIFDETESSGAGDRYACGLGYGNLWGIRFMVGVEESSGTGSGLAMGYGISNGIGGSYCGDPKPASETESISGFGFPSERSEKSLLHINGYPFVIIGANCFLISKLTRDAAEGFIFGYQNNFLTPCKIWKTGTSFSCQVFSGEGEETEFSQIETNWIF